MFSKSSAQTEVPRNTDSSASCWKFRLIELYSTIQETKAILHSALVHVMSLMSSYVVEDNELDLLTHRCLCP